MASGQAIDEQGGGRWRSGVAMAWRWITAILGGYAFAVAAAMLTARLLPAPDATARVEATGWPMILSFLLYAGIGLWALHEVRLGRVSAVIWGGALAMAVTLKLLGVRP
ncbi:iron transporter [Sphingomonas sp. Xoc002]|uniref:iron transporter n=1 Tax=Sphingomonas sp. Xoc002 TaxID=2837624 RepID=UPI003D1637E9